MDASDVLIPHFRETESGSVKPLMRSNTAPLIGGRSVLLTTSWAAHSVGFLLHLDISHVGYIEEHLLPQEQVVARTNLHGIALIIPLFAGGMLALAALGALITAITASPADQGSVGAFGLILLLLAAAVCGGAFMTYKSAEFAVTTSRLILKQGWLSQHTLELQLNKVEVMNVDQTLTGRLFGFGTLRVGGTGGTKEVFSMVSHPEEFRTAVHAQVEAINDRPLYAPPTSLDSSRPPVSRVERDCPYCAERILAAAKICRFCNREVSATVG